MATELQINGTTVDITDLDIELNFRANGIQNPAEIDNSFSYDADLPGSCTNNIAFGDPYATRITSAEYTVKDSFNARLYVGGDLVFDGTAKIKESANNSGKAKDISLQLIGDAGNWYNDLKNVYLSDLNWPTLTFSTAAIAATWTVTGATDYAYYPVIGYGQWQNTNYVTYQDLRPAIFLNKFFYLALTDLLGYEIRGNFVESALTQKLAIPFFGEFKHSESYLESYAFSAKTTAPQNITTTAAIVQYNDDTSSGMYDNGNHYDIATYQYTASNIGYYKFYNIFKIHGVAGGTVNAPFQVLYFKNGVEIKRMDCMAKGTAAGYDNIVDTRAFGGPVEIYCSPGDLIDVRVRHVNSAVFFPVGTLIYTVMPDSILIGELAPEIQEGATYDLAGVLDSSIPVAEIIRDLFTAFRLHQHTDYKNKIITIEPRNDFYYSAASAVDWTEKVHSTSNLYKDYFTSTLSRNIKFKFANDSNDAMVKAWEDINKDSFHSSEVELQSGFPAGVHNIEMRHFAPQMMYTDYVIAPGGVSIPQMWSEPALGNDRPPYSTDFKPRLVYFEGNDASISWNWGSTTVTAGFPVTYVVNPDLDNTIPALSFNSWETDQNGFVKEYWDSTLNLWKYGYVLKGMFNLTASDIASLYDDGSEKTLWRKLIWLNLPEGGGYFTLNAINNYRPGRNEPVEVELLSYFVSSEDVTIPQKKLPKHYFDLGGAILPPNAEALWVPGKGVEEQYQPLVSVEYRQPNNPSVVLNNGSGNQAPEGLGCIVGGVGNVAVAPFQTLFGTYAEVNPNTLFAFGKGTGDGDRSNAFEVRNESGNYVVYINGTQLNVP